MADTQKNPYPTIDIIIEVEGTGIVLIERRNEPYGWALPGGFVDVGETLEDAAIREAKEETSLDVELICQMHAYSAPKRDARFHSIAVVFVGAAEGTLQAGDDAKNAAIYTEKTLPENIAFDHRSIIKDYFRWKREGFSIFEFI